MDDTHETKYEVYPVRHHHVVLLFLCFAKVPTWRPFKMFARIHTDVPELFLSIKIVRSEHVASIFLSNGHWY
jgi:hypothetical protein